MTTTTTAEQAQKPESEFEISVHELQQLLTKDVTKDQLAELGQSVLTAVKSALSGHK